MTASVHHLEQLLLHVLVQLIIMIAAARLFHGLALRLGQPGATGEIVAGLLLGPSLFGALFPEASLWVFGSKPGDEIAVLSQVGLILLMFQIGSEFHFNLLKDPATRRTMLGVAAASILVPFALGLALGLASAATLAPAINPVVYSLFCGVALAITAVPILGRILRQFGLTAHPLGVIAISAAAVNDVIGWLLLAAIAAIGAAAFDPGGFGLKLLGLAALGAVLMLVVKPLLDRLIGPVERGEKPLGPDLIALILALCFGAAIVTSSLGIFAIFGGFAVGITVHRHQAFAALWRDKIGVFVLVFFLPIFFTFTGLRTNVLGLDSATDIGWCLAFLAASILGKILPVYAAARLSGFTPAQSGVLGSLMNTRALMELIVLNVGRDMGFIPQDVFTMLVIMAITTTLMTGPLLRWLLPKTGHVIPQGVDA
ncbi:cation:proton antiporter [Sandaracinobacteroides saxicola]|uniref:Cation:proton antiporter n=1 Tax=Sandaracinobacteroides saxicola TaxID=2759707 RepID=A0A7G5IFP0_9SPHN|nr:cation:proton antiporter [Sandaracinobacteroides saxicola]QMW22182.1 cation:proton antiporter [Sandaracinobacteroides saxicola]